MKLSCMKRRDFMKSLAAAGTGMLIAPAAMSAATAADDQPDPSVKRVLVMFKCHFDAGFIDTQYNVVQKYFKEYYPQAIEVARAANGDGKRRYVWTTGSWLMYEYLQQASTAERSAMEEAIRRGDIAWHAIPFTWQTEFMSPSMIEGSLALSRSLDERFDRKTTGAKMTDVPGHTRGLIPPLAKNGVNFLDIGVNVASRSPEVPPLFLWKDPSGASLPTMYHGDYGGEARVPGSDLVLVIQVRGDNSGPHTPEEIAQIHADLATRFPNAEVTACNLTDMGQALVPFRDKLPVVTAEIGDTWIYGIASDPLKVARYRELSRLRDAWIAKGAFHPGDTTDLELLRPVLLQAEHTWGTDTKTWLDFDNYTPADLARMLETKKYKVAEYSWIEKRQDLLDGIAALPQALRQEAHLAIQALNPVWPVAAPKAMTQPAGKPIETTHFTLQISARTGAIVSLRNKATGRQWASEKNPVALLTYQTLSQDDYRRFISAYVVLETEWAPLDFGKHNMERFGAKSEEWHPHSAEVSVEETPDAHRVLTELSFHDPEAFDSGRAAFPRRAFVDLLLPKAEPTIHMKFSWFGKPATRLPEALWLTFNPIAENEKGWTLDKSGESISPFEVVASGNRHMHSLESGFRNESGNARFAVETIDAPVVALGERTPLLFSNAQPDLSKGVHSCLYNNAWGTNYIMWYGDDLSARYVLKA